MPAPTTPFLDWSSLRKPLDSATFEGLCRELLRAIGLEVRPGQDDGETSGFYIHPAGGELRTLTRVECWPQRSTACDLEPNQLQDCFSGLRLEGVDAVVIITNTVLSPSLVGLLERIIESPAYSLGIGYIDRPELERFLACFPKVYNRYFDQRMPALPEDLDCNRIRTANVSCLVDATSRLLEQDTKIELHFHNASPAPERLRVSVGDQDLTELRVVPFGSRKLSFPLDESDISDWPAIAVHSLSAQEAIRTDSRLPAEARLRIDHLFVDPAGWCPEIQAALAKGAMVYLSGGPGSGKSRLLKEVAGSLTRRPAWIDLSEGDYGTALVDHLLSLVFDIDSEYLRRFAPEFLDRRLRELGCDGIERRIIEGYIQEKVETVGGKALTKVLLRLSGLVLGNRTLIVDNIHRVRHLDVEVLQQLMSGGSTGDLIVTARDQEIEDTTLDAFLLSGSKRRDVLQLALGSTPIDRLIGDFIRQASVDVSTSTFLMPFRHAPNMQQFILTLKNLRARGVLEQDGSGRLVVGAPQTELRLSDYGQLITEILETIAERAEISRLKAALELAAVYGFSFDVGFVEDTLGENAGELLDLLEEKELIQPEGSRANRYRFDHELTQEIIYRSISSRRKRRWHEQTISHLESPERYRAGVDDGPLSRHYEAVGGYGRSTKYAIDSARFLIRRGGLLEGSATYSRALDLAEKLRLASDSEREDTRSYVLEARALEGLIDTRHTLQGSAAVYDFVRKLDTLMRLYPSDDEDRLRLQGRVAFYFARYFNLQGKNTKARPYMVHALELLEAAANDSNLGEALCRASTLEKNCGDFGRALELAERAVTTFREAGDLRGLSMAYLIKGAVSLESGEPEKTVRWWRRAVEVVEGSGADHAICMSQVDYAAILALVSPVDPTVEDELLRGYGLARRLAIEFQEARSLINLANWSHFHGATDCRWPEYLDRADYLVAKIGDGYLRMLCAFSMLNLRSDLTADEEAGYLQEVESASSRWMERLESGSPVGDNRVLAIRTFLQRRQRDSLPASPLEGPAADGQHEAALEYYRRGDRFLTIY